jgi:hypothetical protein
MKHAGKEVTSRRKLSRIVHRVDTTGKEKLMDIMRTLEPDLTKKAASLAYDRVTAAVNGWIMAYTRDLPHGLHARLLLRDCFSVNLCWIRGRTGKRANFPALWVQLGDKRGKPGARAQFRRMRLRAWSQFKANQPQV